jgi:type VI secretion system protein ImpK
MPEPNADAMYLASAEVLSAAAQLGQGRALPSADVVRQQMIELLRGLVVRCRNAGIPDAETAEARYAVVAFVDDRVLKSNWPGRAEWQSHPLQLQFFREFTAGENFYARMRALVQRGQPTWALEAYYLCVALGFAGAMPGGGGQQGQRAYLDAARAPLLQGKSVDRIAPNAIPAERHRTRVQPFPIVLVAAVACALICLLGLVGLQLSLGSAIRRADVSLAASKTQLPPPPAGAR